MHHLASTFWNAATWNDGERSHSQLETTKSTNDSLLLGADEREESKRENPLIVNKYTQLAEFQHALDSYGQKVATKLHFASMREINPVRMFVYWVICLCLCVCLFIRPHSIGCGLLLHSCVCLSVGHDREPYKNDWTDRDAVWGLGLMRPKEPSIMSLRKGHFEGGNTLACPDLPAVDILNLIRKEQQRCGLWLTVL